MTAALVTFALRSTAPFDALFDRGYASEPDFEIFKDAFELGQTCRWSGVR